MDITETYHSVEKLIWRTTNRFHQCHTTTESTDDLLSIAHMAFVEAYHSYDSSKGASFSTWTVRMVWWHLLNANRDAQLPIVDTEHEVTDSQSNFHLFEFLEELTEDARIITKLILDTPTDLAEVIQREYVPRATIRRWLIRLGWTAKRITESFAEIRRALS